MDHPMHRGSKVLQRRGGTCPLAVAHAGRIFVSRPYCTYLAVRCRPPPEARSKDLTYNNRDVVDEDPHILVIR